MNKHSRPCPTPHQTPRASIHWQTSLFDQGQFYGVGDPAHTLRTIEDVIERVLARKHLHIRRVQVEGTCFLVYVFVEYSKKFKVYYSHFAFQPTKGIARQTAKLLESELDRRAGLQNVWY